MRGQNRHTENIRQCAAMLSVDKQRLLMADMALHLLQTALKKPALDGQELKKNLYSILTIADGFLPDHALKTCADQLYQHAEETSQ